LFTVKEMDGHRIEKVLIEAMTISNKDLSENNL